MRRYYLLFLFIFSLSLNSCYKKFTEEVPELWQPVDFTAEFPIDNIYAGPNEVYLATAGEFVRINEDNEVIEQRALNTGERVYGRPMLSDYVFSRVVRPPQSENIQALEFHLIKNPNAFKSFKGDAIATDVSETLSIESTARNTGAFNKSGSQYLLPTISARQNSYSFFLFDIKLNAQKTEFTSVRMARRINIPDIPPDFDAIVNMKFINGFYYVTAIEGAFRIDPSNGTYVKLFNNWFLDAFEYEDNIYLTGLSASNFFRSEDNGVNWERVALEMPTELRQVEVVNNNVLTQPHLFQLFEVADENLQKTYLLEYNLGFSRDNFDNFSMAYFKDNYYLSVSKEVYVSPALIILEE